MGYFCPLILTTVRQSGYATETESGPLEVVITLATTHIALNPILAYIGPYIHVHVLTAVDNSSVVQRVTGMSSDKHTQVAMCIR